MGMMEKVLYENGGGMGLILTNENESDFINEVSLKLHGIELKPNDFFDLDGLFNHPIRYAGVLKDEKNVMCFHAGDDENLFEINSYYYCFYWISEHRIANKYKEGTARDLNWINNKWK